MAVRNAASLTFDGLLKPLTFRTNCSEAARISSSVTGGSKLNRVLMFLHMELPRGVRVQQNAGYHSFVHRSRCDIAFCIRVLGVGRAGSAMTALPHQALAR